MTSADTSWDDAAFRDAVQGALDTFIDDQARRLEPLGHDAARLVEAAHRSVAGGKRFRAAFCYWGYHAVAESTSDRAAVTKAGAAFEILLSCELVMVD